MKGGLGGGDGFFLMGGRKVQALHFQPEFRPSRPGGGAVPVKEADAPIGLQMEPLDGERGDDLTAERGSLQDIEGADGLGGAENRGWESAGGKPLPFDFEDSQIVGEQGRFGTIAG